MQVLDLFSGIGGFSLGLEMADRRFDTVAFCEKDAYARRVLRKNWPDVPIFEDVKELTGDEFSGIDVLCGGVPCQPYSFAGKRRGAEDDRHLWPEMHRLVASVRPSWVIAENVAGHINMGLDEVLSDLEGEGYTCWPLVIPACAVDAPHRRDRVWIVANAQRQRQRGQGRMLHDGDELQAQARGTADTPGAGGEGQPTLADPADPNDQTCSSERGRASLQFGRSGSRVTLADTQRNGLQGQREDGPATGQAGLCGGTGRHEVEDVPNAQSQASLQGDGCIREVTGDDGRGPDNGRGTQGDGQRWLPEPEFCGASDGLPKKLDGGFLDACARMDKEPQGINDASMRVLWGNGEITSPPQRPRPDKQFCRQLADALCELPHEMALGTRQEVEAVASAYVYRLRQASIQVGAVQHPSNTTEALWLSLPNEEAREWSRLAAYLGPFHSEWPETPRVTQGVKKRVDRLKGLGNAVVPQVVANIGRAIIEAERKD